MTKGVIQGREKFLSSIANKLGRAKPERVEEPSWTYKPQWEVYKKATQDELLEVFLQSCKRQGTDVVMTSLDHLKVNLAEMIQSYGGGPIVASNDPRFESIGIRDFLSELDTYFWNLRLGDFNIEQAKQATIGISFSDQALAESGTTVFFHNKEKARSISLLPKVSIVLLNKSSIVPRLTQVTKTIGDRVKQGETIESYINMVSGPSNSADIEMNMVVGVHGPIKVGYLILEDQ
ncbi:lactate utilization protein C [Pullulanibacillus sp. KACC 23026]|uniref:LutC/YkgG family protein n=1 Tax=Pullulanibacillus sp. KACC 23026 TaxID=3028315 RepID=UPI0023B10108|nr:lactate utilization protein C [Pullulanibacillus sp. KACC 23026]WEG10936.1 lactate utilization protein C [Pullulanibacillus sp. KACC 23026]